MKLLKNRGFAAVVLIAAIVLSSLYGLSKKPDVEVPQGGIPLNENLSTTYYEDYIVDEANVLSAKAEKSLCLYNANWEKMTGGIVAVVTVRSAGGDLEDAVWNWFDQLLLNEDHDAVLLLDTEHIHWRDGGLRHILRPSCRPAFRLCGCRPGRRPAGP